MNDRQTRFVESYLAEPNATSAAIKAGYSKKTAYSIGQRLLKTVEVQNRLKGRVQEAIITADEILADVREIAKKKSARDSDRLKAYELLGKHLAMWIDKSEGKMDVSVSETNVVRPTIPDAVTDDVNGYSN